MLMTCECGDRTTNWYTHQFSERSAKIIWTRQDHSSNYKKARIIIDGKEVCWEHRKAIICKLWRWEGMDQLLKWSSRNCFGHSKDWEFVPSIEPFLFKALIHWFIYINSGNSTHTSNCQNKSTLLCWYYQTSASWLGKWVIYI